MQITQGRNAKTLTPSHMKQCILSESRFDFLKDLVKNIPDASTQEDNENNANEPLEYSNYVKSEDETSVKDFQNTEEKPEIVANFYTEQGTSAAGRTPVIQYSPKVTATEIKKEINSVEPKINITVDNLNKNNMEPKIHINVSNFTPPTPITVPSENKISSVEPAQPNSLISEIPPPPLIPINQNFYGQNSGDNLYIDEDYDN